MRKQIKNVIKQIKVFTSHKIISMSVEDALAKMEQFSTCPTGSALISSNNQADRQNRYDLTVIIPVYNGAEYIGECLDSLFAQKSDYTFKAIVINDGSTDNTDAIIREYAHYDNLQIITQVNKGVAAARNAGLDNVESEYVMFLDGDDALLPGAIQCLMDAIIRNETDIVEGNFVRLVAGEREELKNGMHNDSDAVSASLLRGYPWGKVFKSYLFEHIRYPEGFWYEDSIFRHLIYTVPDIKVSTVSDNVYLYRINPKGVTISGVKKPKCIDSIYVTKLLYDAHKQLNLPNDEEYYKTLIRQFELSEGRIHGVPDEVHKSCFVVMSDMLRDYLNNCSFKPNLSDVSKALIDMDYGRYVAIVKS